MKLSLYTVGEGLDIHEHVFLANISSRKRQSARQDQSRAPEFLLRDGILVSRFENTGSGV